MTVPGRVVLHVGAPKTGTSFVQDILFIHRDALRERGILYAADRHDAHFLAALDLMDLPWGGLEAEAVGAWDRLAAEVRDWPGTAIISHEIFGRASRIQVKRALESLAGEGREIDLVVSARDLQRQIPAEWQENVKHRRVKTYAEFLADLRDPERTSEVAQWFWSVQEVPDVLDRWAESLPRERVHLVTVPPPGSPPLMLWQRFAGIFGVDPEEFVPSERTNASLGVAESTMVRRLNTRVNGVLDGPGYRFFVRELVVHRNLAGRPGSVRLALPEDARAWTDGLARSWVSDLALRGYDVVGDLDELLPSGPPPAYVDPDTVAEHDVCEAALDAVAILAVEAERLRQVEDAQRRRIEDLEVELDAAYRTSVYRFKQRCVEFAQRNLAARIALGVYRRLRGSSSRST